jgi:hypothetical protein
VGTFNQSGNGAAGGNRNNCGGDNCQIGAQMERTSYAGNISGGAGVSVIGGPAEAAWNKRIWWMEAEVHKTVELLGGVEVVQVKLV